MKVADCIVPFRHPDRRTISPVQTEQPSVAAQCTTQSTTNLNPRVNGGAISTPGEESSKKSTAVDSSSKAPVVCDPVVPTQRLRQGRRSLKPIVSGDLIRHELINQVVNSARNAFSFRSGDSTKLC
jgi:hypothetical protein